MTSIHDHDIPRVTFTDSTANYVRRTQFLRDHSLPGLEDIKLSLGSELADIFLSTASNDLKRDLNYEKRIHCKDESAKLQGPMAPLWLDPDDLLFGKMVLTEPFPRRKVQATMHKSILTIGENLHNNFVKEAEERLANELAAREEAVRGELIQKIREALYKQMKDMQQAFRDRIKFVKKDLIQQFQGIVVEKERLMCMMFEKKLEDALKSLQTSMAEELEIATKRKHVFDEEVCMFMRVWDSNQFNENFKRKLNSLRKKWMDIFTNAQQQSKEEKHRLRIELEQKHLQDLIQIQNKYDRELDRTVQAAMKEYTDRIKNLNEKIAEISKEHERILKEKELVDIEQYSWCYLVRELLTQFQKLINFTMKSKPGTAEYMLSLEKLLTSRIDSLSEAGFLKEFLTEKGSPFYEEKLAKARAEMEAKRKEMELEGKMKPQFPCFPKGTPPELSKLQPVRNNKEEMKALYEEIERLLDSLIKIAVPKSKPSLPCIPSGLLSHSSSTGMHYKIRDSKQDLEIMGKDLSDPQMTDADFTKARIKSVVEILNNYPTLKKIIIESSTHHPIYYPPCP